MSTRRIDNVNWRWGGYFFALPTILFYCPALTGCVSNSPGITNLYIFKIRTLEGTEIGSGGTEIRIGYFGICLTTAEGILDCTPINAHRYDRTASGNMTNAATDAAVLGVTLQTKLIMCLLAAAGSLFLIGLLLVAFLQRNRRLDPARLAMKANGPSPLPQKAALMALWMSVGLSLAAALSVHQVVSTLQYMTPVIPSSPVAISSGLALLVIQWMIFACSLLFTIVISALFSSRAAETGGSSADLPPPMPGFGSLPPMDDLGPLPPGGGLGSLPPY